jgi:hypothetical protein
LFEKLIKQLMHTVETRRDIPRQSEDTYIALYALHRVFDAHNTIPHCLEHKQDSIHNEMGRLSANFERQQFSFRAFWDEFKPLLDVFGFQYVAVLIDLDVSRPSLTRDQVDILQSIINTCHRERIVVKCFFVRAFEEYFNNDQNLTIRRYWLKSDVTDLQIIDGLTRMLEARLGTYALLRGDPRSQTTWMPIGFEQLCVDDLKDDINHRLAVKSNGLPRSLLHLAKEIIEEHCKTITNPEDSITRDIVDLVLT